MDLKIVKCEINNKKQPPLISKKWYPVQPQDSPPGSHIASSQEKHQEGDSPLWHDHNNLHHNKINKSKLDQTQLQTLTSRWRYLNNLTSVDLRCFTFTYLPHKILGVEVSPVTFTGSKPIKQNKNTVIFNK